MKPSLMTATVDFSREGVQHGFLKMPHSRDDSAWGAVLTPVTVVSNGEGPTALLTGANHGDEYEGPIALSTLAHSLQAESICGRVIIVPFMNYAAFRAARRTSPLDGANMNRIFPGRPDGSVSEKIADYYHRRLLPLADFVLDFHSGGKTLEFVPFAAAHILPDKVQQQRCVAAMRAFAAPYSLMLLEIEAAGLYDTAAEQAGKVFISTELGGGGSSTAGTVEIASSGVRNLLIHADILKGDPVVRSSIDLEMPDERCYLTSETAGLLEPCVELGAQVRAGQLIARVHDCSRTGVKPVDYHSTIDGLLAGRHFPGLIGAGDCLAMFAVPATG